MRFCFSIKVQSLLMPVLFLTVLVAGCAGPAEEKSVFEQPVVRTSGEPSVGPRVAEPVGPQLGKEEVATGTRSRPAETRLFFDFDSIVLDSSFRSVLDKYAIYLRSTNKSLRVEGHTDERGTQEYNLALGKLRADAVVDYLVRKKVQRDKIEPVSYGEEKPVSRGRGEQAWSLNRRADLLIR